MGYRGDEEDECRISRCASCSALVFAEIVPPGRTETSPVCAFAV